MTGLSAYAESRKAKQEADDLRASRNKISKEIGVLMAQGKKEEAEKKKAEVASNAKRLEELEEKDFLQLSSHYPNQYHLIFP